MRIISLLLVLIFASTNVFSQVRINYENPHIFAREKSGQYPTQRGYLNETGTLILDKGKSSVTMISDEGTRRVFEFYLIQLVDPPGHYLGYGDDTMFTLVPEDRIFFIMYKENRLYNFVLSEEEVHVFWNELSK